MADIFDVIADATRRDLLNALLDRYRAVDSERGELSVGELVELLGLSQPTVSKHLRVLRDINLVAVREEGQHRYYSLEAAPLQAVEEWVIRFLASDLASDLALDLDLAGEDDPAGSAVFAAWSGADVPAPLRRAAESLQHSEETGRSLGRAVADVTHSARVALEDATSGVRVRVIEPITKRLGRRT